MSPNTSGFKTTNADGSPKTCKFCHQPVWWSAIHSRWYNPGGEVLHVTTCEKSQQHYHDRALNTAEDSRQNRNRGA